MEIESVTVLVSASDAARVVTSIVTASCYDGRVDDDHDDSDVTRLGSVIVMMTKSLTSNVGVCDVCGACHVTSILTANFDGCGVV